MKAIKTTYHGPTNFRQSRIVASAEPHKVNRISLPYDHELDAVDNHEAAAAALCTKMGWTGELRSGCIDMGVYVHVFI